ncbi:DUF3788 family protein [Planctomycetota bacterium]
MMALSHFDDKDHQPNNRDLAEALGRTKKLWDDLIDHVAKEYNPATQVWSHSGEKYGWSVRLIRKKRTILYLIPQAKHFLTAFVLGKKATDVARESNLPEDIMTIIEEAPVYGEGRGFRIPTRNKATLNALKKLAAIKMAN